VTPEYKLKNGDRIVHHTVRREPPVTGQPIPIVAETEDFVVVNKPSSLPAHPCGAYRYNTLPFILAKDHGYEDLHTMHRLDRLTSGVVLLARNKAAAELFTEQMTAGKLQKEYVARVKGIFPKGGELVECNAPIACVNVELGEYAVDFQRAGEGKRKAKEAKTLFKWLHTMPDNTSLVRCFPKTGRTHQIRVHLQYLGYPIANDECYGGDIEYPGTRKLPHILHVPEKKEFDSTPIASDSAGDQNAMRKIPEGVIESNATSGPASVAKKQLPEELEWQERAHAMEIWLHAHRYKSEDWEFMAELPPWAAEAKAAIAKVEAGSAVASQIVPQRTGD